MLKSPTSSQFPYLISPEPNVRIVSLITTGDAFAPLAPGAVVGSNLFGGIPDGIGAFDNGDGTMTVLVNHEIGNTQGVLRDHGAVGSYIDRLVIDKASLAVLSGDDAIKSASLWNAATHAYDLAGAGGVPAAAFTRFCSGDLAAPTAFYDAKTGLGTTARLYLTGEEAGNEGRPIATILTGPDSGHAYELAALGNQSFENLAANPFAQARTIVATTDDTGGGQVYIYVGDKQASGTDLQKAGLDTGVLYGIKVAGVAAETDTNLASLNNVRFTMEAVGTDGNVKDKSGLTIQNESVADGILGFQRPEDAAWDPNHPNVLYFVTTNGFPTAGDANPSRLWRLTFDDIANPAAGGKIEAVLDGTEGQKMFDNITVANGKVILQEDPGNQGYIAKVWEYDIATDTLHEVAAFNPAKFTPGVTGFITQDEESSGILDVTSILGGATTRAYLLDAQVHAASGNPATVEQGQLMAMFIDKPVLTGGNGADNLFGSAADETLSGFNGDDSLRAGSGVDQLYGGNGNDRLDAGAGNDVVNGGNGNDRLIGGLGDDFLAGGRGDDIFYFDNLSTSVGDDRISDFAGGDRLYLTQALADLDGDGIIQLNDGNIDLSALDVLSIDGSGGDPLAALRYFGTVVEDGATYYAYGAAAHGGGGGTAFAAAALHMDMASLHGAAAHSDAVPF